MYYAIYVRQKVIIGDEDRGILTKDKYWQSFVIMRLVLLRFRTISFISVTLFSISISDSRKVLELGSGEQL